MCCQHSSCLLCCWKVVGSDGVWVSSWFLGASYSKLSENPHYSKCTRSHLCQAGHCCAELSASSVAGSKADAERGVVRDYQLPHMFVLSLVLLTWCLHHLSLLVRLHNFWRYCTSSPPSAWSQWKGALKGHCRAFSTISDWWAIIRS